MSLAADTREALAEHPFLVTALRAGVVNYTAAARFLEVGSEVEAVATALARHAEELPAFDPEDRTVRVRMESGIGAVESGSEDALLSVGSTAFGPTDGDRTAIVAAGDVDALALADALERLSLAGIEPRAAGVGAESLLVVVDRLEGANALRALEGSLERGRDRV